MFLHHLTEALLTVALLVGVPSLFAVVTDCIIKAYRDSHGER